MIEKHELNKQTHSFTTGRLLHPLLIPSALLDFLFQIRLECLLSPFQLLEFTALSLLYYVTIESKLRMGMLYWLCLTCWFRFLIMGSWSLQVDSLSLQLFVWLLFTYITISVKADATNKYRISSTPIPNLLYIPDSQVTTTSPTDIFQEPWNFCQH